MTEEAIKKTYLVMWLDPDNLPRAWGHATKLEAAQEEADRQLDLYRKKKEAFGDPLAYAQYKSVAYYDGEEIKGESCHQGYVWADEKGNPL